MKRKSSSKKKTTKKKSTSNTKRRKAAKKKVVRGKRTTARQPKKSVVKPSKTRRIRGGSASDVDNSLLLNDIGRLKISKKNKMKIVKSIANRLGI